MKYEPESIIFEVKKGGDGSRVTIIKSLGAGQSFPSVGFFFFFLDGDAGGGEGGGERGEGGLGGGVRMLLGRPDLMSHADVSIGANVEVAVTTWHASGKLARWGSKGEFGGCNGRCGGDDIH